MELELKRLVQKQDLNNLDLSKYKYYYWTC